MSSKSMLIKGRSCSVTNPSIQFRIKALESIDFSSQIVVKRFFKSSLIIMFRYSILVTLFTLWLLSKRRLLLRDTDDKNFYHTFPRLHHHFDNLTLLPSLVRKTLPRFNLIKNTLVLNQERFNQKNLCIYPQG